MTLGKLFKPLSLPVFIWQEKDEMGQSGNQMEHQSKKELEGEMDSDGWPEGRGGEVENTLSHAVLSVHLYHWLTFRK